MRVVGGFNRKWDIRAGANGLSAGSVFVYTASGGYPKIAKPNVMESGTTAMGLGLLLIGMRSSWQSLVTICYGSKKNR